MVRVLLTSWNILNNRFIKKTINLFYTLLVINKDIIAMHMQRDDYVQMVNRLPGFTHQVSDPERYNSEMDGVKDKVKEYKVNIFIGVMNCQVKRVETRY